MKTYDKCMFGIRNRYVFIFLLAGYSFLSILLSESLEYYQINLPKFVIFLLFIGIHIGIWEGNRFWDQFLQAKNVRPFWKNFLYQVSGSFMITFIIALAVGTTASWFIESDIEKRILYMKLLLMFSLRINLFLNTIHLIFVYHRKLKKSREELENYKRISSQAQLQSLKNQVNPHFLFNNLSVLTALIPENPDASVEFVRQFSKVYRYVLKSHKKEIVELNQELDFIESYLYLLKTRFDKGLIIKVNLHPDSLSAYTVPISLQMLVENAVKHNIVSKNKPLKIEILNSDRDSITVRNNFQPKSDLEDSTRTGLSSIGKRYEFLGHKGIKVRQTDDYFSVTMPLIKLKETSFINSFNR